MKPFSIFLFSLVFSLTCYSQNKRANNWYFGYKAGISFNTEPPTVLIDGQMEADEGCSTISDENGKLLFYTNGITVWNKQHKIMTNGTDLKGDASTTQAALIIPYPEHPNLYYIFTAPDDIKYYYYSIVDMSLDNGLGSITTKNIQLLNNASEKLAAVYHSNGKDIWVIVHQSDNDFYSYLITTNGINSPIITKIGSQYNASNYGFIGYMKISPDGKKIATALYESIHNYELFDFDNSTGKLSNCIPFVYSFQTLSQYGLEFSPDASKLFLGQEEQEGVMSIKQFDLNAGNEELIKSSAKTIGTLTMNEEGITMQLATNGKIYITQYGINYLNVIDNPNNYGSDCNYKSNALLLKNYTSYGLPNFISSYFYQPITTFSFSGTCLNNNTKFSISSQKNILSIFWNFGDSTTSSEINPSHTYTNSATYNVQVTVNYQDNTSQTLSKSITIEPKPSKLSIIHN